MNKLFLIVLALVCFGCSDKWDYRDKKKLMYKLKSEMPVDVHLYELIDIKLTHCLSEKFDKSILDHPNIWEYLRGSFEDPSNNALSIYDGFEECFSEANYDYYLNLCTNNISKTFDTTFDSAKCYCKLKFFRKDGSLFKTYRSFQSLDEYEIKEIENILRECEY